MGSRAWQETHREQHTNKRGFHHQSLPQKLSVSQERQRMLHVRFQLSSPHGGCDSTTPVPPQDSGEKIITKSSIRNSVPRALCVYHTTPTKLHFPFFFGMFSWQAEDTWSLLPMNKMDFPFSPASAPGQSILEPIPNTTGISELIKVPDTE